MLPQRIPVVVENKFSRGWKAEPDILGHLTVKLTGAPSGASERHDRLRRANTFGNVTKDVDARGQADFMRDLHAFGKHVVLAVKHKSAIAIHRTTDMYRVAGAESRRAYIQLLIEVAQIQP